MENRKEKSKYFLSSLLIIANYSTDLSTVGVAEEVIAAYLVMNVIADKNETKTLGEKYPHYMYSVCIQRIHKRKFIRHCVNILLLLTEQIFY